MTIQAIKPAWDTEEWRKWRDKKLHKWFMGNEAAVRCLVDLSTVSESWDDLIDEDTVPKQDINNAFIIAMIGLPQNPFYREHREMLEPLVIMTINAWLDSEVLIGREDRDSRMRAFFIRNLGVEIAPMIAFCIGGFKQMRMVSLEIRDFLAHETYDEWEFRHHE